MAAWTELSFEDVVNGCPTEIWTLYKSWVDANPPKAHRLRELVLETVATFRGAVAANPACVVDPNPATVPTTGFRHALNLVIFNLGMEMGVPFSSDVATLATRADVWLRMVQSGTINPVTPVGADASPSYRVFTETRAFE